MRLSKFMNTNREPILAEWAAFARTCVPASDDMDLMALRDHAEEMLVAIAADLDTAQTPTEQSEKSMGRAASVDETTAAHEHGSGRAESGFTMDQMVSEYRALRASVIRLWALERGELGKTDIEDLIRFNEAIDQSLAESVARYANELDRSREMFLAILGHDLRTPLGAVITSATFMLELGELEEPYRTLMARIASSSRRMDRMVGDLLDLTRSRLGGGISIQRVHMDMQAAVHEVASELKSLHPAARIEVRTRGDLQGRWDPDRVSQILTNLMGNALAHGSPDSPVTVAVGGEQDEVVLGIHNYGVPIPPALARRIFDPMKRRESASSPHLGLGLYIAERLVAAHDGRIAVESSASTGTTFSVYLPRSE